MQKRLLVDHLHALFCIGWLFSEMLLNKYNGRLLFWYWIIYIILELWGQNRLYFPPLVYHTFNKVDHAVAICICISYQEAYMHFPRSAPFFSAAQRFGSLASPSYAFVCEFSGSLVVNSAKSRHCDFGDYGTLWNGGFSYCEPEAYDFRPGNC